MTSASQAKSLVTQLIDCINRANAFDAYALLSAEVIVTVNGTTPLSGRYPGLPIVRGVLVDTARSALADLQIEIAKAIGSRDTVACQLIIQGRTNQDGAFNAGRNACSCVFDTAGGLITEIALYPDTSAIEMELYGKGYVSDDS